jgi:predicted PurR-regulated permease PerM
MKIKLENKYFQIGLTLFLTAVSIMAVYFLFFKLSTLMDGLAALNKVLAPITYGMVIAYLITPLLNFVEKKAVMPVINYLNKNDKLKNKEKISRLVSLLITFTVIIYMAYAFFANVIPELYSSVQSLINHYTIYTNNLVEFVNKTLEDNPEFAKMLSDLVYDYSSEADNFLNDVVMPSVQKLLLPNINTFISSFSASLLKIFKFLWNVIIGIIISIYVLVSKERFAGGSVKLIYAFLSKNTANAFVESVRFTHKTFIGFLSGKIFDSLIIGIICYFGCLIIGIPYALLISVIIGVTNVIPFFGPYLGAVPSTLIILLVNPKMALYFVIFILVLQQVDGNFIGPMILSQSTGITSFWIIVSITVFGGFWGVIGMIIGVPLTAVILAGINKISDKKLKAKDLPTGQDEYFELASVSEDGTMNHNLVKEEKKPTKPALFIKKLFVAIFNGIKKAYVFISKFIKDRLKSRNKNDD